MRNRDGKRERGCESVCQPVVPGKNSMACQRSLRSTNLFIPTVACSHNGLRSKVQLDSRMFPGHIPVPVIDSSSHIKPLGEAWFGDWAAPSADSSMVCSCCHAALIGRTHSPVIVLKQGSALNMFAHMMS